MPYATAAISLLPPPVQPTAGLELMQALDKAGFEQLIHPHFLPSKRRLIMRAYRFAKHGHREVMREDGSRYFEHPKILAILLIRLGVYDVHVIIAALLHDILEDTYLLELEDIEDIFGPLACHVVHMVSKLKKEGLTIDQYFARLLGGGWRSWLVKCADRLHNLSTLVAGSPERAEHFRNKKIRQVAETRDKVIPLALALSEEPGFEEIGRFFLDALTEWCNFREAETLLARKSPDLFRRFASSAATWARGVVKRLRDF
jgi:(p)ppGpp synthase/HD superfamily hydrolase